MDQLGDEELMVTIAEGETGALEALYDRYGGPSYSLALRILGDREAAEEVVQDAFVAVWRSAETYDPKSGRLYSWLLKITRNRAIDELRLRAPAGVASTVSPIRRRTRKRRKPPGRRS